MDTWTDLMRTLQLVNQKEINPSQEGVASLHECLRFLAKVAKLESKDLLVGEYSRNDAIIIDIRAYN